MSGASQATACSDELRARCGVQGVDMVLEVRDARVRAKP